MEVKKWLMDKRMKDNLERRSEVEERQAKIDALKNTNKRLQDEKL